MISIRLTGKSIHVRQNQNTWATAGMKERGLDEKWTQNLSGITIQAIMYVISIGMRENDPRQTEPRRLSGWHRHSPGHADVVEVEPGDGFGLVAPPVSCGASDQPAAARCRLLVHLVAPVHGSTHTHVIHTHNESPTPVEKTSLLVRC